MTKQEFVELLRPFEDPSTRLGNCKAVRVTLQMLITKEMLENVKEGQPLLNLAIEIHNGLESNARKHFEKLGKELMDIHNRLRLEKEANVKVVN